MKKKMALMMALTVVLLCGCSKKEETKVVSKDSTLSVSESILSSVDDQKVEENDVVKEFDHSLVCDRWADSGSFKMYTSEDESFDFYFDYSIPQIIDDTEDAKEINYFIECLYKDMHDTMQKASKEGQITAQEFESTEWFQTNYDCYWNATIASIVIYSTGYYSSETRYNVYNYDFSTGTQLSNEDIFALKGTTGEKFAEGIRRAAVYSTDAEMQMFFESEMPLTEAEVWYADVADDNVQLMYADYLLARAKTVYNDNINEFIPIYLDANGEIQAITHIYNMSMYGEAISILSPKAWINNELMTTSGDLLSVSSKDDGLYLTINKEEWSYSSFEEYPSFDFTKEHKIEGLYKNYKDARISWVGNGNQPYILLLSDDGMVSYVDVMAGISSGYFSAIEPLWGLENIKAFSESDDYRIVGENNDGKLIDVEDALYMMLNCRCARFEKGLLNLSNVTRYSATVTHNESGKDVEYDELIGFTDDKYQLFVRESYKKENYEGGSQVGYIYFNGMNENGMVFRFYIVGEEGEISGSMALNVYSYWDSDLADFVDGADVTWLGGFDIFESHGNRVALQSSVG